MIQPELVEIFRAGLLQWASGNPRPMPWKGEKDPYKIWLSEIVLQQTRVEQGWPYYEKLILKYPNVHALAQAPEDELFKYWEGLGYYNRARNLHATAKYISTELGGRFPHTYETIRTLKGVGDYTAAAIASFGFGLPYAVLDGNVFRILARFFAIDTVSDSTAGKKEFSTLAQQLIPHEAPGAFNQAMMDFGALCCMPAQPQCPSCTLQNHCQAFKSKQQDSYPVRQPKKAKKQLYFLYLVVKSGDRVWIRKRQEKDIWRGLHEFPYLAFEDAAAFESAQATQAFSATDMLADIAISPKSDTFRQTLTHRQVTAVFQEIRLPCDANLETVNPACFSGSFSTSIVELKKKFAFPGIISGFLKKFV
ncbi:MAG: A/G-specific adenine glycosylase [Saprospiraceae bacterium]|nr:A/G-specific adenine glycosylase [Saprospiraceae bacterium]